MSATAMEQDQSVLSRIAQRCCAWSERWFPDAFAFAVLAVAIVAAGALIIGAPAASVAQNFGSGFWSLIPFTMQMTFIIIGGYVVADSPPVARIVERLAALPGTGRGAVALVAFSSAAMSLVHWGLSLVFTCLLVRALARRAELSMDYRAAGAAACTGLGSVWALGLSSSAAQLQANPASMPPALLAETGVIPFGSTIFLWQSLACALILVVTATWIAWKTAPGRSAAQTAEKLGIGIGERPGGAARMASDERSGSVSRTSPNESAGTAPRTGADERSSDATRTRPGEWLEFSPLPALFIGLLGAGFLIMELSSKGVVATISNLNTYNFLFIVLGLVLQWRPRRFLESVARAVPSAAGVLIQFPFLGAIAGILTGAKSAGGETLSGFLGRAFTQIASHDTFAPIIGVYSAVLGLFVPSGGGKWIIEAPYVMHAANAVQYNLGWTVQIYNAAEALPNLINPFWMLPILGILHLRARDLIGFTVIQFVINLPLVLALLWVFGATLPYHPPVAPAH
jgi:short-chain fatty acids transporter